MIYEFTNVIFWMMLKRYYSMIIDLSSEKKTVLVKAKYDFRRPSTLSKRF